MRDSASSRSQEAKARSVERWHPPTELRVEPYAGQLRLLGGDGTGGRDAHPTQYRLNDWSFTQLCSLAGVSKDTVNRLSAPTPSFAPLPLDASSRRDFGDAGSHRLGAVPIRIAGRRQHARSRIRDADLHARHVAHVQEHARRGPHIIDRISPSTFSLCQFVLSRATKGLMSPKSASPFAFRSAMRRSQSGYAAAYAPGLASAKTNGLMSLKSISPSQSKSPN